MKFEISEENQRKFNVVLGIIFVITNLIGIPLTITSSQGDNTGKTDNYNNQPFGISDECNDQIRHDPSELVSSSCVDELIEVRLKVTRIEKRINDARSNP